ncbi:MAG TPA: hypothetical protein VFC37_20920 [Terracidiphilus sp.]|nr:hypothetical protein [Terracidiphilus sp.]
MKQTDLIPMHIRMFHIGGWKRFEVFVERLAWNIGESRRQGFSLNSVMAFGAQINLPVAGKICWIQNAV